ncbi:type 1 glutamine amidotransferase [Chlorobium sp. KB01]|uniref:type 1 glutamine amidotransferase n=1 Tax=Chlorobium sp. KB01 TaxID=1917528 RepID=UPI0009785CD1|nr:type 1 glutamine amidotransferase [Chlorobium sp. KB01]
MKMPLLIVKNITHEAPGLIETVLCQQGIKPRIVDLSAGEIFPDPVNFSAVIVLGGPQSANDRTPSMVMQLHRIEAVIKEELPFLGICLGMQTLVKAGGGEVITCPVKEIGFTGPDGEVFRMQLTETGKADPLFCGLSESIRVFQLHGETVELAAGMKLLASGKQCPIQAVRVGKRAYGLQCHAEMTLTMFLSWLALDADLKRENRTALIEQFESFRHEYTATGMQLVNNFLRISGLAS